MMDTLNQVLYAKASSTVYAVPPETPAAEAAVIMREMGIGALLVTEADRLVGIVTERDLMTKVVADRRDCDGTLVGEVMTGDPMCVAPTTPVGDAMAIVSEKRIRHLPVVDEDARVVGLISSRDLMDWVIRDQKRSIDSLSHAVKNVTRAKAMVGLR
jgi:CBS domain-containing protein